MTFYVLGVKTLEEHKKLIVNIVGYNNVTIMGLLIVGFGIVY